uniref:ATP-binding cassette domain-containing protein n=1 Tax=uncultured Microbacterium sp. TaxID=191216 RepID=UPI0025E0777D
MSLEVTDLVVEIDGRRVVDGVSFAVPNGARVGLIGESGSGKSLTALAVMGLLPRAARLAGGVLHFADPSGAGVDLATIDE